MKDRYYYKEPKDTVFWLISAILITLFALYLSFIAIKSEKLNLLLMLFIILFLGFGLTLFEVCFIRNQYKKINFQTTISIDKTEKAIIIERDNNIITIKNSDIRDIEIYRSWNSKPPFYDLGYTKFNLTNGDNIVITNFITDETKLAPIITKKKKKYITRLMNPIM